MAEETSPNPQHHSILEAARVGAKGTVAAALLTCVLGWWLNQMGWKPLLGVKKPPTEAKLYVEVDEIDQPFEPVFEAEVDVNVPGVPQTYTDSVGAATFTVDLTEDVRDVTVIIRREQVEVYRRIVTVRSGTNSFRFCVPRSGPAARGPSTAKPHKKGGHR